MPHEIPIIAGCITVVVVAGVCTGHDGYLLLTGIGALGALLGWGGKKWSTERKQK